MMTINGKSQEQFSEELSAVIGSGLLLAEMVEIDAVGGRVDRDEGFAAVSAFHRALAALLTTPDPQP